MERPAAPLADSWHGWTGEATKLLSFVFELFGHSFLSFRRRDQKFAFVVCEAHLLLKLTDQGALLVNLHFAPFYWCHYLLFYCLWKPCPPISTLSNGRNLWKELVGACGKVPDKITLQTNVLISSCFSPPPWALARQRIYNVFSAFCGCKVGLR